jgi:hypothetical protein
MKQPTAAKRVGLLSIACSLTFWLCACIFLFTPIAHRADWELQVMVAFQFWIAVWILGFLLGLVAAALGSRYWLFAALLAPVSCGAAAWLASGIQW